MKLVRKLTRENLDLPKFYALPLNMDCLLVYK